MSVVQTLRLGFKIGVRMIVRATDFLLLNSVIIAAIFTLLSYTYFNRQLCFFWLSQWSQQAVQPRPRGLGLAWAGLAW